MYSLDPVLRGTDRRFFCAWYQYFGVAAYKCYFDCIQSPIKACLGGNLNPIVQLFTRNSLYRHVELCIRWFWLWDQTWTRASHLSTQISDILMYRWTPQETYKLLTQIQVNPKYTQNFFPTPGHTPPPGILGRYARSLCFSVLDGTTWMKSMKELGWIKVKKEKMRFSRNWVGEDPVTIRLRQWVYCKVVLSMGFDGRLPSLARRYEERLGGYTRYEDLPHGSEHAKQWSEFKFESESKSRF